MVADICAVDGCDRPRRKRGWCGRHYAHWRRHGDVNAPFKHRWADEKRCVICGVEEWDGPRRKFCSGACQQIYQRHGTARPKSVACALCAAPVDLTARGKSGRRKRTDTVLCRRCSDRHHLRHGKSASGIAATSGNGCRLCHRPIDMTLVHPHPMSASVDHIVPRAHGGTDDLDNLQLAHLTCNQKKHTRMQLP